MIKLQTLGGVSILGPQDSAISLRSRKHVGLLLLLAAGGRRIYSRSRLCDLFWSSEEARARHSLSQAVYDLTRQLGPILDRGPGENLSLDPVRLNFDVARFEAAMKGGDLATAVALYQGPFADNLVDAGTAEFERWLDSERTRLARLGEIALRRYVTDCETRGQWGEMCVAALKLAALSPLDEEIHRTFMRALWLQGDAASALRHYESIAAELESELPEGLSDEMKDLVHRIRSRPRPDPDTPRSIDREPPFVGRETEFRVLREAVKGIAESETTAIVVSGEAGIGKSRLMKEFERSIQVERLRRLSSRCYQAEEDLPYTPIVDALTPLVTDMIADDPDVRERFKRLAYLLPGFGPRDRQEEHDSVDPAAWRRQLYEEVASFLISATEREPIVWIVDDVQWIDRTSGGLLHYLSRRLADRPFLLVLTIRNARGVEELPALPVATPSVGVTTTRSLPLRPLTESQIRDIVDHAEPDGRQHPAADLAIRLSAGNPYYALEVLEAAAASSEWARSASDWDPLNDDRLRKVLDIRVSGLGADRRRLLQAIAVLERHARPRLVAEVAGVSIADAARMAEELYLRSLVLDEENRIAFTNDAMREFVYAEMSGLQRAALHLSAGHALEAEADPAPGSLATHFYYGDDWPRSFGYAMEAARSAQTAAGHSEAAHFAGIAAKVAPGLDERRVALETRADSLFAAGELAEAAACYEEILGMTPVDAAHHAHIALRLSGVEITRCRWESAATTLKTARGGIARVLLPDEKLSLEARHSELSLKLAVRMDDLEAARSLKVPIDKLVTIARDCEGVSGRTRISILCTKAIHQAVTGSSRSALDTISSAERFMAEATQQQLLRYLVFRGYVRTRLGEWDSAEADFRQSLETAKQLGDRLGMIRLWNNLACVAIERGDWSRSESCIAEARRLQAILSERSDTALSIALNRGNMLFYQGFIGDAAAAYQEAGRICELHGSLGTSLEVHSCLGLIALQRGTKSIAIQRWERVQELLEETEAYDGGQERFKLAWFTASMTGNVDHLKRTAELERERDVPSYAKLMWLDALMGANGGLGTTDASAILSGLEMSWFSHFSRRWMRAAIVAI